MRVSSVYNFINSVRWNLQDFFITLIDCSNKNEIAKKGIDELKMFFEEIGALTRPGDLAISRNDLPAIAKHASANGKFKKLTQHQ